MNAPRGRPTFKPVAVGATDKVIASANPKRKGIIICNCDSASTVYLAPNQPAVAGQGIALGPVYDDIELTEGDWGLLPGAEWHAIASLVATPGGAVTPAVAQNGSAGLAVPGVKTSLVIPAGMTGVLRGATFTLTSGVAGTQQLQIIHTGTTIALASLTADGTWSVPVGLSAGDTVQWNVTVASAGGTGAFTLAVDEYAAGGAVPSSAQVGVIELEG